jgi:glycosyltransferase involved in cell wall biosynthesis
MAPSASPSVSIVMNVLDGAPHLREAVDSVLAQTDPDWELIVWDDRSTDESADIIAGYDDERIRYFLAPERTPLGRARDQAIRRGTGAWIAFLDQDDVWLPHKLERQMALVRDDPDERLGIVYGRTVTFLPDGRERDYDHRYEFAPLPEGDVFVRLFETPCFIAMSSFMFPRARFDEIGGIPDAYQVVPDYFLFLALARRHRARAVQEPICRYRLHPGGMSDPNRRRLNEEVLALIDDWESEIDPRLAARRRRVHHTCIAVEDMKRPATLLHGVARVFTRGAPVFLATRPFARAFRAVRRHVRRPYYRRIG